MLFRTYPFSKLLQDIDLDKCLLMKSLLVADDLDRNQYSCLMVDTTHDLPKASFAEKIDNLVTITKVVAFDDIVISTLIIITEVGGRRVRIANDFVRFPSTCKVDILKVNNLTTFKNVQIG